MTGTRDEPIVIVGAGMAGYALAKELRRRECSRPITLVTADSGRAYSKPMLSNALAQRRTAAALESASAAALAERLQLQVMTDTQVTAIDRDARMLQTNTASVPYADLVLAIGAQPIRVPITGDAASQVVSVNDLDDYAAWRERLVAAGSDARVLVIGAGLIGCEFANDLITAGFRVTVVDPAARPLGRLAPAAVSDVLAAALASSGVDWRFGRTVRDLSTSADRTALIATLDDGTPVSVDCVLSAVGLRARVELARDAGLATGAGIVVDRMLATTDPRIFALGDCAQIDGQVRPYVAPLLQAARALAATLSGVPTALELDPAPVVVKTPTCPVVVLQPAATGDAGRWVGAPDASGIRLDWRDNEGVLRGFALAGDRCAERPRLLAAVGRPATEPAEAIA